MGLVLRIFHGQKIVIKSDTDEIAIEYDFRSGKGIRVRISAPPKFEITRGEQIAKETDGNCEPSDHHRTRPVRKRDAGC